VDLLLLIFASTRQFGPPVALKIDSVSRRGNPAPWRGRSIQRRLGEEFPRYPSHSRIRHFFSVFLPFSGVSEWNLQDLNIFENCLMVHPSI